MAEKEILSPYMLNNETFIARQKEMSSDLIKKITDRIERFPIEEIETIITEIDDSGAHIFVVRSGVISCDNKIGFASVGIGSYHALSHFMFSAYTRFESASKALLTIHQAKKKSEVSPGVGAQTDMFLVGPSLGSFVMIDQPDFKTSIVKYLDNFYIEYKQEIEKLDKKTEDKITDYLRKLTPSSASKQESGSLPSPSQPPQEGN